MKKSSAICFLIVLSFFIIVCAIFIIRKDKENWKISERSKSIEVEQSIKSNIDNAQEGELYNEKAKIKDVIIGGNYKVALLENGTVWSSNIDQSNSNMRKISQLKDIVKIMEVGDDNESDTFYALSKEGSVYAWGKNQLLINHEDKWDKVFTSPVKLQGLQEISAIDASNGTAFALDKNGVFYTFGMALYSEGGDYIPGFPEKDRELVKGVKSLFAGAGNYHYFIREDGSIFSIMEASLYDYDNINPYIFPVLENRKEEYTNSISKERQEISLYDYYNTNPYVYVFGETNEEHAIRISESKEGRTILHELGNMDGINLIGSDVYTAFLYNDKENALKYWQSKRIEYHDNYEAMVSPKTFMEDYGGNFIEVDIASILNISQEHDLPHIVDICSGKENTLFLTEDGQVFISEYVIDQIQDVTYYWKKHVPGGENVISDMKLKTVNFHKILETKNIRSINSDGLFNFSAVDADGICYGLNMTPTEDRVFKREG